MKGEFCRFRTSDGLELQGLYVPAGDAPANGVVLHVHGLDGSFYENRFIDAVAAVYNRHGLDFLTFNNRGHDYISDILVEEAAGGPATYRQAGGMYEVLEECVADIAAAAGFARGRGCRRVLLEGHSHGALKVLYYLVRARDPAVSGLVLMSPSDDFATARAQYGDRFAEGRVTAERMVGAGRGAELMPEGFYPYPTSARTFHDLFKADSLALAFNLARTDRDDFPELGSVRVPVLLLVGTVEEFFTGKAQAFVDAVGAELGQAKSFSSAVIEDAPHNYLGHESEVAAALDRWLVAHPGV
jgi:pimeloyl-ACP methyl ester carboxylesterase